MLKTLADIVAHAREGLVTLTIEQATPLIKKTNSLFIDVREPSEFTTRSAKGAINIPRGVLEPQMLQKFPDEHLAIFVHCATGARATLAAEQLVRLGYQNVRVIISGLDEIIASIN